MTGEVEDRRETEPQVERPRPHLGWLLPALGIPLLVATALHVPWLDDPFGPGANNAGSFFGVYARTWDRHGFFELRGLPVAMFGLGDPAQNGVAYLNHPPLAFWASAGGDEPWRLRMPSFVAHLLLVLFIGGLALGRERRMLRAAASALAVAVAPCLVFWVGVSYELPVMAIGVLLWMIGARIVDGGHRLWHLPLALAAFAGVWLDWSFGLYCLALWPLATIRGGFRRSLEVAGVAALGVALAIGSWWWWAGWAQEAPKAPRGDGLGVFENRAEETIGLPADWGVWAEGLLERLLEGHGVAFLVAGAAGLVLALFQRPRITLALLTAAVAQVVIPAEHARTHIQFTAFLVLPLALGIGCLASGPRRLALVGALVAVVACGFVARDAVDDQRAGTHAIFADLGLTLDEASADFDALGQFARAFDVGFNLPYVFPYYIESPFTAPGILAPAQLQELLGRERINGLRFLLLEWEVTPAEKADRFFPTDRRLVDALEASGAPATEIPRLITTVRFENGGFDVHIRRARVFTLVP